MQYKFVYQGRLEGLNEYLKAQASFSKKHSCGNDMKQNAQFLIINAIRLQLKRLKITKPITIQYHFYEPNRKRDLDNISAVGHKFIQDALVKSGVIENDGWANIVGFQDAFYVDKHNPRIEVILTEVE